jgi:riboflavin biosynthesis protein RibD
MNPAFMREALDLARKGRAWPVPIPWWAPCWCATAKWWAAVFTPTPACSTPRSSRWRRRAKGARRHALRQSGALLAPGPHAALRRRPDRAGVARVVAPIADPNPLVAGDGIPPLREAGIEVEMAAEFAAEAEKLNEPFLHFMRTGRPLVTLKTAITLDGKISAPDDNRGWITSERARAHVQELRHDHDAILTGIGTVLADDCLLTDRTGFARSRPLLRIVMDSQLRLPLDSKMVRSAPAMWSWSPPRPLPPSAAKPLEPTAASRCWCFDGPGGRADLRGIVEWLGRKQYLSLMIEAGSKLNWTALESGCVDRIFFYYGPKILGGLEALPLAGGIGGGAARRRHSHRQGHHSPHPARRVRRRRIRRCSPGSLKNWAPWIALETRRPAPA